MHDANVRILIFEYGRRVTQFVLFQVGEIATIEDVPSTAQVTRRTKRCKLGQRNEAASPFRSCGRHCGAVYLRKMAVACTARQCQLGIMDRSVGFVRLDVLGLSGKRLAVFAD